MLWVDKYRPKSLYKVLVHQDTAQNLKKLVTEQDCPHLLFYWLSRLGKKTLIMVLLRQMFEENNNWKVDAGTIMIHVELTTLSSTHHVEVNAKIIKEMAKNLPIDTKVKRGFKEKSLCRTMEKCSACSNSSSKVTEATNCPLKFLGAKKIKLQIKYICILVSDIMLQDFYELMIILLIIKKLLLIFHVFNVWELFPLFFPFIYLYICICINFSSIFLAFLFSFSPFWN
ncbi:hypothetical protein Pfo_029539 [Paulownia fortunei]|nr:hypothetical protein Pfo_029539 [Paulownia fortunei]